MRKWLHDNPWIWVVVFLGLLVAGSLVVLVIAQLNRPVIVKDEIFRTSVLLREAVPAGFPDPHPAPRA